MGTSFTKEIFNAREILLSADMMRAQALLNRDLQDEFAYQGAGRDGAPISALDVPPVLAGIAGGFTANMAGRRGFWWNPTFVGLTADESGYLVLRWADQVVTFTNPDGAQPRIDLIVGTPGMVNSDAVSRNILVNPNPRTITPQSVFKTSSPVTALQVIAGTAAATPAPPAVPAGTVAIMEVYVPAGAADATAFVGVPRLWKKVTGPTAGFNGPLDGCELYWQTHVDPASANPLLFFPDILNRCFIEGELIETGRPATAIDSTANPFASAASAGAARPYFVYLCGGRYLPQGRLGTTTFCPTVLVESTVVPDIDGHPVSNITTPRGVTRLGAVYVGLGFVHRGTTNRLPMIMDGVLAWASRYLIEIQTAVAASPMVLASLPTSLVPLRCVAGINSLTTGAGLARIDFQSSNAGAPTALNGAATLIDTVAGAEAVGGDVTVPIDDGSNGIAYLRTANFGNHEIGVKAYEHKVKRIRTA